MKNSTYMFCRALLRSHMQAKERRKDALAWRKMKRFEREKGPISVKLVEALPPVEEAVHEQQ